MVCGIDAAAAVENAGDVGAEVVADDNVNECDGHSGHAQNAENPVGGGSDDDGSFCEEYAHH